MVFAGTDRAEVLCKNPATSAKRKYSERKNVMNNSTNDRQYAFDLIALSNRRG